jgi:hypothetical protein
MRLPKNLPALLFLLLPILLSSPSPLFAGIIARWDTAAFGGAQRETPPLAWVDAVTPGAIRRGPGFAPTPASRLTNGGMAFASVSTTAPALKDAIAQNAYVEIIVTPEAGAAVSLKSLSFSTRLESKESGPLTLTVRSSLDGFAADLAGPLDTTTTATATAIASDSTSASDITASFGDKLDAVTKPFALRVYAYGAGQSGKKGTLVISNHSKTGGIMLEGDIKSGKTLTLVDNREQVIAAAARDRSAGATATNAASSASASAPRPAPDAADVKALGSRLEVVWDSNRLAQMDRAWLELHPPALREVSIVHDKPWEGNVCCYHVVFKDGPLYRMYYRGAATVGPWAGHKEVTCYAESDDGITWRKPELGLVEFEGSTANNIVWAELGAHNFSPFLDNNPACPPDQRYKAVGSEGDGSGKGGLHAFVSADGLRWRKLQPGPVLTDGNFDSQNTVFWDAEKQCYTAWFRGYFQGRTGKGMRGIKASHSPDFIKWSAGEWVEFEPGTPEEELYTNAILPYPRAPGIYVGFPKRFTPDRLKPWDSSLGGGSPGVSDGVFMSSRDGRLFRRWSEAFLRPGLQRERWINRNNMTAWGLVETESGFPGAPRELSLYSTEDYYSRVPNRLRRMTVRLDGFASARAAFAGGAVTTKPLTFAATPTPAPAPSWLRTIGAVRTDALHGAGALKVREPLTLTLPGTMSLGKSVTLAVAFRDLQPGRRRLFSTYNGGSNTAGERKLLFDLHASPAGLSVRFWYNGAAVELPASATPKWQGNMHLAATYDDGVIIVYINGIERGRGGSPGGGRLRPEAGDVRFGEDYPPTSTTNEPFLGLADDITVLGRALTAAEIATAAEKGMAAVLRPDDKGVFLDMEDNAGSGSSSDAADATASSDGTTLINRLGAGARARVALPKGAVAWGATMLLLNASTSAAGSIRCEIRDMTGRAVPGFALSDCHPLYGDEIEMPVTWKNGADVASLAGKPVVLHFELKDADLFAYRFGQPAAPPENALQY